MLNLLRLNLQFFSADTGGEGGADQTDTNQSGGTGTGTETPPGADESQSTGEPDKTFSQEDVNNIASRETKKAQEKLFKDLGIEDFKSAKEGMKKFQEWQEAQKSEADKQTEKLTNLEKSHADVESEKETYKAQINAFKAGVNADSVEDVVTLAKTLVTKETDMDAAIQQVIEKYPHFGEVKQQEEDPGKPKFSTGKHSTGGTQLSQTDFNGMTYAEKVALKQNSPEVYKSLSGQK